MKALLVYPTHANCREAETPYRAKGAHTACYPARQTKAGDCDSRVNCWNATADSAERLGFPVVKTVCPTCQFQGRCQANGYLGQLIEVKAADIVLCTHARAEYSGLSGLMKGRQYVAVHENPINLLRPMLRISDADLVQLQLVLDRVLNDPTMLNWFADALRTDDTGKAYHDAELAVRKDRQLAFIRLLSDLVDGLLATLRKSDQSVSWAPDKVSKVPEGVERTLFYATRTAGARLQGNAWRFALAAAAGQFTAAAIIVGHRFRKSKGSQEPQRHTVRSAVGVQKNSPGHGSTVWFCDATLGADRLQSVVGTEVHDRTPGGQLPLQKKAVQVLQDVTRGRSDRIVANILRGVLADRPDFRRVGIIGHRTHMPLFDQVEPEFRRRIVKTSYFGSGEERSSNAWHQECDLIIVMGTPRIPPSAVAEYLVQVGEVAAACSPAKWGPVAWWGASETGDPIKVDSRGYDDARWRRAHQDLVRAQLVQSIGRGRGILESGCEVLVLSNEECGLPISDAPAAALNGTAAGVLEAIRELSDTNSKDLSIENVSLKSPAIALHAGLSRRQTQRALQALEGRGLIVRVGSRSGWRLVSIEAAPLAGATNPSNS